MSNFVKATTAKI